MRIQEQLVKPVHRYQRIEFYHLLKENTREYEGLQNQLKTSDYKYKCFNLLQQIMKMKTKGFVLVVLFVGLVFAQNILTSKLKPAQCSSSDDCQYGYFCLQGKCADRCASIRCKSGTICKQGQCYQKCNKKTPCEQGFYCNDEYCLDMCRFTKCLADHYCQKGKCIPIQKECSVDKDCKNGFFCSEGTCIDKCILTLCSEGTVCYAGKCKQIQTKCKKDSDCKKGNFCDNGVCNDKCALIDCKLGYKCNLGECIIEKPVCPKKITCKDPRPNQKTCPILYFIRQPDPLVCGVKSDGSLIDFAVQCYACKQNDIVFYYNTTCDKLPKNCGKPPAVSCDLIRCKEGYVCKDGKCLKKQKYEEIYCTSPRPNEKTCPTLNWIRQPDALVCGINKKGEFIDFPVQCYACKQKKIVFYYNTTCQKVFKQDSKLTCDQVSCEYGFYCQNGKCIKSKTSQKIKCTDPRPTEKYCPTVNFIRKPDPIVCGVSDKGDLIDFPVECYACKQKNILYYYNTTCNQISTLKCASIRCKDGYYCVDGQCVPQKFPVCSEDLQKTKCQSQRPTEKTCPLLYFFAPQPNKFCAVTSGGQRISYPVECYSCKNKEVEFYYNKSCEQLAVPCKSKCKKDFDCKLGFSCQDGKCVDKCISATCLKGYTCKKGYCIPPLIDTKCFTVKCSAGHVCKKGKCVKEAVDQCKDVICIATHTCKNGKCVISKDLN